MSATVTNVQHMTKGGNRKRAISLPPVKRQPPAKIAHGEASSRKGGGTPAPLATEPTSDARSAGPSPEDAWKKSRHGAIAGRGFHYQDAVGVWVAVGMLTRTIDIDRLVPEGHDDLTGEGPEPIEIQVKSRQMRVGDFAVSTVAKHVLESGAKRAARGDATSVGVIVLERNVLHCDLPFGTTRVGDLPAEHPLRLAIDEVAKQTDATSKAVEFAHEQTNVVLLAGHQARAESVDALSSRYSVPPAIAEKLVLVIRDRITDCVDHNAEVPFAERDFVDRTRLEALVGKTLEQIDFASLSEAIRAGICEPLDLDTPLADREYFAGVDAQPGHVAAGLSADRPQLTEAIAAELLRRRFALFTGPSGVGKSTATWSAASELSNVTWFRVLRLEADDVQPLTRFAGALAPSERNPVGFVIDGVGMARAAAWDDLVYRVAAVPNVLLLGSARTEDLVSLATLPSVGTVEVRLDEETAEAIYEGLRTQGATHAEHWRAAFESAGGYTLEYTHLLTQGRRLEDVIAEQVRQRVIKQEDLQLQVLAIASVAHSAGCSLSLRLLQRELDVTDTAFRSALLALHNEHLVREQHGRLVGLHQLRSRALSYAVHESPPPLRSQTLRRVLSVIEPEQVTQMLVGALLDWPDQQAHAIDLLSELLHSMPVEARLLSNVLLALRIVDASTAALEWAAADELARLDPEYRSIAVQLALTGVEDLGIVRPEVAAAVQVMTPTIDGRSALRDQLVERLGPFVGECLNTCGDIEHAANLVNNLRGADLGEVISELQPSYPLASALSTANPDALGELLYLAEEGSTEFALRLLALAGGEETVLERIRTREPLLLELGRRSSPDGDIAYGRLIHIHDRITADTAKDTKRVARMLVRCLPGTERADVETLIAKRRPL